MDEIAAYDPQKGSQIDQAFEELKRPAADAQSCLRIAKALIHEGLPLLERKDENRKGSLIRWLIVEALNTNASLFGLYAPELQTFFSQLLTRGTANELEKRTKADAILATMQQGETFQSLKASQKEVLSRLKAHKPLVVSIIYAGYGDSMLMTPLIEDIAKTLKIIGSRSTIRYIVKQPIADLIRSMLRAYENIEVIPFNRQLNEVYTLYLAKLAVEARPEVQFDSQGNTFIADYAEKAGVILGWEKWGEYPSDSFLKGTVYQTMRNSATEVIPVDNPDNDTTNTSRRSSQRWISQALGVKIFDTSTRDDITTLSQGVQAFINEYLTATASEGMQATLHELQETPGFEQGFVCIVIRGSNQVKRITPSLSHLIAHELADFCRHNQVGIVFICSPGKAKADEQEDASAIARFLAHGIPTFQFNTANSIADTFVMLQRARGVIGPDTFLTHAAEYFQDKPVVNFLVDSSRRVFRLDERVISVQHPIAKRAEEDLRSYVPFHSDLYAREFVHPFTPLPSQEEQAHFHPFIQEAQYSFLRDARGGLCEFQRKMRDSS